MQLVNVLAVILSYSMCARAQPEILDVPIVCNIQEGTQIKTELKCFKCDTAASGYSVSMMAVSPSYPCNGCFDIYPKDPKAAEIEYCLYFLASQGVLNQRQADKYTIAVQCKDSNNATADTDVQIRVMPNSAPAFELKSDKCKKDPFPVSGPAGEIIYDEVSGSDPDNDTLYYSMTTTPPTDNFEIGISDGVIRSKNLLKFGCHPKIAFHISVKDARHQLSGPKSIECNFEVLTAPLLTNINKTLNVPEDFAVGDQLIKFSPTLPAGTELDMSSNPPEALYLFDLKKSTGTLKLKSPLNYENEKLRSINLTIIPDNQYCKPFHHFLHIMVTDVNDLPELSPKHVYREVEEGMIRFTPGITIIDEDEDLQGQVVHYYSITSDNSGNKFKINPISGEISTTEEYDVDKGAMPEDVELVIQVNDTKGPDVATATVHLHIQDTNDNPPVFRTDRRTYVVTECEIIGKKLGYLTLEDKVDSGFNHNNDSYVESFSNGKVSVDEGGRVYLVGKIRTGTSSFMTVYGRDRGLPDSQRTRVPATIRVTSEPCPTTPAPTTVRSTNNGGRGGGGGGGGSYSSSSSSSNSSNNYLTYTGSTSTTTPAPSTEAVTITIGTCSGFFCDTNSIMGIVFGALGALALLTCLGLLISKYCIKTPEAKAKAKAEKAEKVRIRKANKSKYEKPTAGGYDFWNSNV